MNIVDLSILLLVGFGLFIGWSRGLIGPLLAEAGFVITFLVVSTHPGWFDSLLPGTPRPLIILGLPIVIGLAVGVMGRLLFGAMFRLPLARSMDKLLGAGVHGLLGVAVAYVVLLGVSGIDRVLGPINGVMAIRSSQVAAMSTLLAHYPQAGSIVTSTELAHLNRAASVQPVPVAQLGQYSQLLSWYEKDFRPQVAHSVLAPIVARVGEHLPIIGRPVSLPH
jgi:uncharacterized membrane protein required for colicin V production